MRLLLPVAVAMVTLGLAVPQVAVAAPQASTCVTPQFADGLAQSVFPADQTTWLRGEAWVQTPDDSDHDGVPDRVHVDITRPAQTADPSCHYRAPVVFEDSPYYAGIGPAENWQVDHDLGTQPPPRPVTPDWPATNTSPIVSRGYETTWLPRGFAVVHAESPGTGLSTGCPTSGGPNETNGGKAVIDWLNGRAPAFTSATSTDRVQADWASGKVAMIGTSYNGTLPEAVASTGVDGLAAIVPISAISDWYDYYRANGMVRAPFTFQGEDLDVLADAVYSRADRAVCQPVIAGLAAREDRVTGNFSAFWNDRNTMRDVRNVHAAVLMAHGDNDFNVMTKNMAQFYDAIKAQGVPHMLYFHQGGHGGAPPDVLVNRWFTRYLFGVRNDVEQQPKAWVVREANACPARQTTSVGDQANVTTLAVADSSRLTLGFTPAIPVTAADGTVKNTNAVITKIPDGTHVTLSVAVAAKPGEHVVAGAVIGLPCSSANPTPYAEWPDPATGLVTANLTAGAPGVGGLTLRPASAATETLTDDASVPAVTSANAATSGIRLLYQTPALATNVRISGTPWASLWVASSAPRANLTVALVDYPPTGNGTILTRGWLDPQNRTSAATTEPVTPGQSYRLRLDLQPKDAAVVAGHRLGLMVLASDQEATIRTSPGTKLSMDLARSTVTLPVVGGTKAFAAATGGTDISAVQQAVTSLGLPARDARDLQLDNNRCQSLDAFQRTVFDKVGAGRLTAAQASLLQAVNQILLQQGCFDAGTLGPWVTPERVGQAWTHAARQVAEQDLLELAGAGDGLRAIAAAGQAVVTGRPDACVKVRALSYQVHGDAVTRIADELGCSR